MTALTFIIWATAVMAVMALVGRLLNEDSTAPPASQALGARRPDSPECSLTTRVLCNRREPQRHTRPARLILYDHSSRRARPERRRDSRPQFKMGMIHLYTSPSPYRPK